MGLRPSGSSVVYLPHRAIDQPPGLGSNVYLAAAYFRATASQSMTFQNALT